MWSCRVILTCVITTVACVASVCLGLPLTLALDRKLESHSAFSPVDSGGIPLGGAAGSNARLAKATGCFWTIGAAVSLSCRGDDPPRHASHPNATMPSSPQTKIKPRKDNTPPDSPIVRIAPRPNHQFLRAQCRESHCFRV